MPEMTRDEAIQRLVREVAVMSPDDLAEAYNELFPTQPTTEDQARQNGTFLRDRLTNYINREIHPEEVVSLWNVVFPKDRHVSYDEDTDTLHYGQTPEFLEYVD